jgi:hypothetical protein
MRSILAIGLDIAKSDAQGRARRYAKSVTAQERHRKTSGTKCWARRPVRSPARA